MDPHEIKEQFDIIAQKYDDGRKCFIPCMDEFYGLPVGLLKDIKPDIRSVADLGAGTGLLSKEMYIHFPQASFTLIDLSDEMLNVAKERFKGIGNITYQTRDYTGGFGSGYDCICSALSIHHLENKQKRSLYKNIFEVLPEGGVFLALDQFCYDNAALNSSADKIWLDYIGHSGITDEERARWIERRKLDREVSVQSTVSMLSDAGFNNVDIVFHHLKFAALISIKM